ncbi:MAG: hypothetical protein RLZZ338_4570 [Cyanobacteriota bacterium]
MLRPYPTHKSLLPSLKSLMAIDKIIVPLDVSSEKDAIALLDTLPQVSFWKVGLELFVSCGPSILQILKEREKRIFLDLKFHDIPNTVAGACRAAARYGVDLLTLHPTIGTEAMQGAIEAVKQGAQEGNQPTPKLIAISLLTSLNGRQLAFELKIPIELPEYALHNALLAKESGLDGAVCSPHEVEQIRQTCGDNFLLVCPGVRPSWAEKGDQKRTFTPAKALKLGADFLVIGRPITASPNPADAWAKICDEIASI